MSLLTAEACNQCILKLCLPAVLSTVPAALFPSEYARVICSLYPAECRLVARVLVSSRVSTGALSQPDHLSELIPAPREMLSESPDSSRLYSC